jgi:competence ComEA-like helix-hairpin-helix protein
MKNLIFLILIFSFSFVYAECSSGQIDINTASLADLEKIAGIGPVYAQRIIDLRPYAIMDDLEKVKGIGPATLEKIKSQGFACISGVNNTPSMLSPKETKENLKEELREEINENKEIITEKQMQGQIIKTIEQDSESIILSQKELASESIINLNSDKEIRQDEIIYQSKNELVKKYAIYVFAIFLSLIIIILLIKN